MNPNGFFEPYLGRRPSWARRWSATNCRYSRVSAVDMPGTPWPSRSSANWNSHSTASPSISVIWSARRSSNSSGCSDRTVLITSKAKFMWHDSSRNTQLVPAARPFSRPFERRK